MRSRTPAPCCVLLLALPLAAQQGRDPEGRVWPRGCSCTEQSWAAAQSTGRNALGIFPHGLISSQHRRCGSRPPLRSDACRGLWGSLAESGKPAGLGAGTWLRFRHPYGDRRAAALLRPCPLQPRSARSSGRPLDRAGVPAAIFSPGAQTGEATVMFRLRRVLGFMVTSEKRRKQTERCQSPRQDHAVTL